jgi:restriction system protein
MPIPDYETLMLPVLRQFAAGKKNVSECLPSIKADFAISDEDAQVLLPSGRVTLLASRIHWARAYLSKAGLLESPKRNLHQITPQGLAVLARNPDRIDNVLLSDLSDDFSDWRDKSARMRKTEKTTGSGGAPYTAGMAANSAATTPEEQIDAAYLTLNAALRDDLVSVLYDLPPARFERLIVDVLQAMGFGGGRTERGFVTKSAGDGGIDGIIHEDALGLDAVYVQAKRYAPDNKIGRPDIQRFVGSLTGESATKGVFVTTSAFSKEALEYVNRVQQRIVLIDGQRLAQLMIDYEVGVRARRTYVVRSIDEDYFAPVD